MSNAEKRRIAPAWQIEMLKVEARVNDELSCDNHEGPVFGCDACKIKILGLQGGTK